MHKIGYGLANNFLSARNKNKVVFNLPDQFNTNNNCGFNLANFKPNFIRDYFSDVVQDYERSFIGSFFSSLFNLFGQ